MENINNQNRFRESGLELLRIIAACMVVFSHLYPSLISCITSCCSESVGEGKILISNILLCLSVCAVNVFILISGYFSSKSMKRYIGKPLNLLVLMLVVSLGSYVVQLVSGSMSFDSRALIYCFPVNYFVTLFIVLYLISPYVNLALNKLEEKSWRIFLLVVFALFSILPSLIDILEEVSGTQIIGASPIGRLGSQNGYNIVNFVLVYCLGAFLNTESVKVKIDNKQWQPALCAMGCWVMIFVWHNLVGKLPAYSNSALNYHNPFVILLAISLFVLFKNIKFKSKAINSLAKAAFTAFLLHTHFFSMLHVRFHMGLNAGLFVVYIIAVLVVLYLLSWIFWLAYSFVTKSIFKKLDTVQIPYSI